MKGQQHLSVEKGNQIWLFPLRRPVLTVPPLLETSSGCAPAGLEKREENSCGYIDESTSCVFMFLDDNLY